MLWDLRSNAVANEIQLTDKVSEDEHEGRRTK